MKNRYGGVFLNIFKATKPESMLKNHSSSVTIFCYFEHCFGYGNQPLFDEIVFYNLAAC